MADQLPDFDDPASTVTLLLLAEVLARRGEKGPLARVFVPRPRPPRTMPTPGPGQTNGKTSPTDNTGEPD